MFWANSTRKQPILGFRPFFLLVEAPGGGASSLLPAAFVLSAPQRKSGLRTSVSKSAEHALSPPFAIEAPPSMALLEFRLLLWSSYTTPGAHTVLLNIETVLLNIETVLLNIETMLLNMDYILASFLR
jgi:hypothetical protein